MASSYIHIVKAALSMHDLYRGLTALEAERDFAMLLLSLVTSS